MTSTLDERVGLRLVRILIADDNPFIRNHLRIRLGNHEGWRICAEAQNGREAVAKASEMKPDVIVLDLSMPVMDGLKAARELAKSLPHVPVVMYSLYGTPQIEGEAKAVGVRGFLDKAEDIGQLIATIEQLLPGPATPAH